MSRAPTVVIGVGNPDRGDDGVGPAVLARLRAAGLGGDDVELLAMRGEATSLLEVWRGRRSVIVVDAVVCGQSPGTVLRIDLRREPLPDAAARASSHGAGLAEAVALGRAVGALPGRLVVVGVEPASVRLGDGLSPAVEAAVPELVRLVRAELGLVLQDL